MCIEQQKHWQILIILICLTDDSELKAKDMSRFLQFLTVFFFYFSIFYPLQRMFFENDI